MFKLKQSFILTLGLFLPQALFASGEHNNRILDEGTVCQYSFNGHKICQSLPMWVDPSQSRKEMVVQGYYHNGTPVVLASPEVHREVASIQKKLGATQKPVIVVEDPRDGILEPPSGFVETADRIYLKLDPELLKENNGEARAFVEGNLLAHVLVYHKKLNPPPRAPENYLESYGYSIVLARFGLLSWLNGLVYKSLRYGIPQHKSRMMTRSPSFWLYCGARSSAEYFQQFVNEEEYFCDSYAADAKGHPHKTRKAAIQYLEEEKELRSGWHDLGSALFVYPSAPDEKRIAHLKREQGLEE